MMEPVVSEVGLEHQDTFTIARIDLDESNVIPQRYQIRATPTYIVFRDGEVIGRFTGAMPKDRFLQNILNAIDN